MIWTALWLSWAAAGLALEVVALLRPARSDTASEKLWTLLRTNPILWFIGVGLAAWGGLHIFGPTWALPY
jgi:hypothetical protein